MKKFLFIVSLFIIANNTFSQGCDSLFCKTWFDTLSVNQTATFCMGDGKGVVLTQGSTVRPSFDTTYVTQQGVYVIGQFINDTCMSFTAGSVVGTSFMQYFVSDTCGNSRTCNVYIQVLCPTPDAVADNITTYANIANTPLSVTINDVFAAGVTAPTVSIVVAPKNGTVSVAGLNVLFSGNGTLGADTFSYSVCNYCGNCDTSVVYLDLIECTLPVANDDLLSLVQGDTSFVNVIANDSNLVFGAVSSSIVKSPTNGTATIVGGVLTYRSSNSFFGLDTILYRVCTDCGCDTALLVLNVAQAPCTAPDAIVDLVYAGNSTGYTGVYNIVTNDKDPVGGGPLVVTIASSPSYGIATIVNNQLVYNITDTVNRADSTDVLFYSLCNDCFCDTARVTIVITKNTYNGIKPTINEDAASVCRNDTVWINVIANDFDLEGSYVTLSDTNSNSIVGNPKHGTVEKIDSVTLMYIPNLNYFGTDTFVYVAGDNGVPRLFDQARVFINVNECANPPIVVDGAGKPVDTLRITIPEDSMDILCIQYMDADGDWVTTTPRASIDTIVSLPIGLSPNPCLKITPPHDYTGEEGVWVLVCDEYPLCDSVYVIITVTPRADKPVAIDDVVAYTWPTNCQPINVLSNDFDVDKGDTLRITTFTSTSAQAGSVTQNSDSILCYNGNPSFTGVDTFTYVICDQTGLCDTATVIVNVPIKARNDFYTLAQEDSGHFDVRLNDTRFNNEVLSICGDPKHGKIEIIDGKIVYTPNDDYPYDPISTNTIGNGLDSFCYTLCNVDSPPVCSSAMVYITIIPKPNFFIPEGFSPSGDNINDVFEIKSANEYPTSQLLVFNRWGDEVWRNDADGYKNDFAGNYKRNNQPLPDGTYYYIFKFNDNVNKDRMGYIILNR
jgi:gliding motility-associated-like protein